MKNIPQAIARWEQAVRDIESARSAANAASCELTNATNELGRALAPINAKVGEVFSIWHGDALLQVEKTREGAQGLGDFTVSRRQIP